MEAAATWRPVVGWPQPLSPVPGAMQMKICIFFDGQNFYRSLQRYDDTLRVDYDRLATWITQAVGGPAAMFGGAYYYVGVSPDAPQVVEEIGRASGREAV